MRGWIAVNLFLLLMILVWAGALFLAVKSIRALALPMPAEFALCGFVAVASVVAAGIFGKAMLSTLEKRSRAR